MPVVRRSSTSSRASSTGGSVRNKKRKMVVESESSSEEEEDFNYDEKLKKGMAMKKKKLMERQQEKTAASRQRASQPPPVESSDSSSESESSDDDLNISAMVRKGVEEKQRRFIASQKENRDKATMPPPPPNRKTRNVSKTTAVVEDDANLNQSSVIADTPRRTRSSPIPTRSPLSVKTRTPSKLTEVIIPSNPGKTRHVDDMAAVYDVYAENIPSAVQNSPRRSPRSQVIRSPRSIGNVVSTPINEGRMQLLDAVGLSPVVPAVTQAKHLILTAKQKQPKHHHLRNRPADTEKAPETETEKGPEDDPESENELGTAAAPETEIETENEMGLENDASSENETGPEDDAVSEKENDLEDDAASSEDLEEDASENEMGPENDAVSIKKKSQERDAAPSEKPKNLKGDAPSTHVAPSEDDEDQDLFEVPNTDEDEDHEVQGNNSRMQQINENNEKDSSEDAEDTDEVPIPPNRLNPIAASQDPIVPASAVVPVNRRELRSSINPKSQTNDAATEPQTRPAPALDEAEAISEPVASQDPTVPASAVPVVPVNRHESRHSVASAIAVPLSQGALSQNSDVSEFSRPRFAFGRSRISINPQSQTTDTATKPQTRPAPDPDESENEGILQPEVVAATSRNRSGFPSSSQKKKLKKPTKKTNVQVKERYVGDDVFGNYHMLKQSDVKKILRKERPDMKPDAEALKKMTIKLNHFLEDFFTHYCNNTTSPHGFLSFQETFRALKGQILIPAEHTPQQFFATLKEILSPEDMARGEGVLFPSRFSQTFDTADYL